MKVGVDLLSFLCVFYALDWAHSLSELWGRSGENMKTKRFIVLGEDKSQLVEGGLFHKGRQSGCSVISLLSQFLCSVRWHHCEA